MENITEFLEKSSIVGLSLILSTRNYVRHFWILVVVGGFAAAIWMIFESFDNWRQKPISTTIETFPISEIIFPNVTVCPPRNLFLNLNSDIKKSENVKLNKDLRNELLDYSLDVIQHEFYKEVMANLSKLEDPDRFYNWYHGYTKIQYPYYDPYYYAKYKLQLVYKVDTSASLGNISTQYFGEKFDAYKINNIWILISVYVPSSAVGDENAALMAIIEKNTISMAEFRDDNRIRTIPGGFISADKIELISFLTDIRRISYDNSYKIIYTKQNLTDDKISLLDLDKMPGFKFTWYYKGWDFKKDPFHFWLYI